MTNYVPAGAMMPRLNLPAGADAGFRLELFDAFGNTFSANIYGAGRRGWFLAAQKWSGHTRSIGPQQLARGQWPAFLGLLKQAGFWELPKSLPVAPEMVADDGEWMMLAGRDSDRYHEIHRDGYGGRGLFQITRFLTRLSGFFPEPRSFQAARGLVIQADSPASQDQAETAAMPDPARDAASRLSE